MLVHDLLTSSETKVSTADIGVATFTTSDDNVSMCIIDLNGRVNILKIDASFLSYNDEDGAGGIVDSRVIRTMSCKVSHGRCGGLSTFAVPSKNGVCELFYRAGDGKWPTKTVLEGEDSPATHFGKDLNLATFSPSADYLATADVEGVIVVWKITTKDGEIDTVDAIQQYAAAEKNPLVDLVWSSNEALLACSKTGFAVLKDVIPEVPEATVEAMEEEAAEEEAVEEEMSELDSAKKEKAPEESVNSGEEDLNDVLAEADKAVSAASEGIKEKPQRRLNKNASSTDSAASDDEDGLFEDTVAPAKKSLDATVADSQESSDINDGNLAAIKKNGRVVADEEDAMPLDVEDADIEGDRERYGPDVKDMKNRITKLEAAKKDTFMSIQEPFQPSCTANDAKMRRYLVWNSVGFIRMDQTGTTGDDLNRVEITFTDRGGRNKSFAFPDKLGFRIASLSNEGAFFASDIEDVHEEDINYKNPAGSKLFYHAFPGHLNGANDSFYLDLKESEKALCVAVGAGWAAVATSKGLLRIFSSTGVQLHVYWLKGPIVTLVGSDSQLAVFYSSGQPVDGTSRINVELYSLFFDAPDQNRCVLADHSVPISKKGNLVWAGFEKEHKTLVIVDSEGMMSMLVKPLGWQWMPVYDIHEQRKSPDMEYWPIMVSNGNFIFILLNGETQPNVWPKPAETTRELRIPIASSGRGKDFKVFDDHSHSYLYAQALAANAEKSKSECIVTGDRNHDDITDEAMDAMQMQADKMVLIMLQTSLKANQTAKASDLSHKLRTDKGLAAGIQLANKYGKADVARLLEGIQDFRLEQQKLNDGQEQQDDYTGGRLHYDESGGGGTPQKAHVPQSYGAEDEGDASYYDEDTYQGTNDDGYANENEVVEASVPEGENDINGAFRSQVTPSVVSAPATDGPLNPFAKNASPVKRKANFGIEGVVNDFKHSPSPAKKPLLSRQSSFSESARKSQKTRQALL